MTLDAQLFPFEESEHNLSFLDFQAGNLTKAFLSENRHCWLVKAQEVVFGDFSRPMGKLRCGGSMVTAVGLHNAKTPGTMENRERLFDPLTVTS
jgi:hypothetical protein